MATPNMKTFCLASVKPLIRSLEDYQKNNLETIAETQSNQEVHIQKIDTSIDTIKDTISSTSRSLTETIANLKTLQEKFDESVDFASLEEYKAQINKNIEDISTNADKIVNLTSALTNLASRVTTVENSLSSSVTKSLEDLTKRVTALENSVTVANQAISTNTTDIRDIMDTGTAFNFDELDKQ